MLCRPLPEKVAPLPRTISPSVTRSGRMRSNVAPARDRSIRITSFASPCPAGTSATRRFASAAMYASRKLTCPSSATTSSAVVTR